MNNRFFIIALLILLSFRPLGVSAQRENVVKGIESVERLIEAHKWHEAFQLLRQVEMASANTDALRYLTTKERYRMYSRLNKGAEARGWMAAMEVLANKSGDQATIEDMLVVKADYNYKTGNPSVSKNCYVQIFETRAKGKDDAGRDKCFKEMIAEAESKGQTRMKAVVSDLYTAWQDSISAVRASEEITILKDSCANALNTISDQESTINGQRYVIYITLFIILAAAVAIGALFLMLLRGRVVTKRLRNQLSESETNSEQKSVFIRNISKQISPSLSQIATGNSKQHITALENMLGDVERFLSVEEDKETSYETVSYDVSKLCQDVRDSFAGNRIPVENKAIKQQFPVCVDAVKTILTGIINESLATAGTEHITIDFHKRSPHKGQFTITANGMQTDKENPESIFIPFAKVYDLTVTTGLGLPICSLLAGKMNCTVSVDTTFTKGTRFVLDAIC